MNKTEKVILAIIVSVMIILGTITYLYPPHALGQTEKQTLQKEIKHRQLVDTCPKPTINATLSNQTYERTWTCGNWEIVKPTAGDVNHDQVRRVFRLYVSEHNHYNISQTGGPTFNGWSFNDTIPGPTLRMVEGDPVTVFVFNQDKPKLSHNFHMHSIHKSIFDAAGFNAKIHLITPGTIGQYIFTAAPYGVYPYHCHVTPADLHISKGLYGVMIIDPKIPRPPADEIILMSSSFDLDGDKVADYYTYNGVPHEYAIHPIPVKLNQPVRIYLVNMAEYRDTINWHIHGNMFYYWPSGTNSSWIYTDIVTLSQGDRGIIEMKFPYENTYMFHSHQNDVMEKGQMGFIDVIK